MNLRSAPDAPPPVWIGRNGRPIACIEKIRVLDENYQELRHLAQDAFDDGILMGCDEHHLREALLKLLDSLAASFER